MASILRSSTHALQKKICSCTDLRRKYSSKLQKGLVLGVYNNKDKLEFTPAAEKYNQITKGKLQNHLNIINKEKFKEGKSVVFWDLENEYSSVAIVALGEKGRGYDKIERLDKDKEAIRIASAAGCNALHAIGVKEISVDPLEDAEAAAEGSVLSMWKFQEYKTKKEVFPSLKVFSTSKTDECQWEYGVKKADGQNIARKLTDTPANLMTPTIFAERVQEIFQNLNVKVEIHDQKWAECKKMFSFLSVTRGSVEPPKFIELTYTPNREQVAPYILVGKGVTFDAGGISLKPSASMDEMRGDMGGAACVVGTLQTLASMKVEKNLKVLIPLVENLPSGSATKPGDVVKAMNGKSICVDNTDAEGRLILADALCYSAEFNPKWVLDIATLTGAIRVALGNSSTGVFTNNDELYKCLEEAGALTGDRVWQFPLWKHYTKQVTEYPGVDVNNVGKGKGGGSCTAAAFLKEFVPKNVDWMHLDIASVMGPGDSTPYLSGMTGRPTRTLVQFISSLK